MPAFERYIGVDYSGAETPASGLRGLRVYVAGRTTVPTETRPHADQRRNWSRRTLTGWLVERLRESKPTIVGIDHGFSFPIDYFVKHGLKLDWPTFLEDFRSHWPTDEDIYVDFVRDGSEGNGAAREGISRWKRLTEKRAGAAKSVFHFDVPGSVAKSTHAGLPWLLHLRRDLGAGVHFWPFDGWTIPASHSAIVEVYPSLWSRGYPRESRTSDQHDAYAVAAWLKSSDESDRLVEYFNPQLTEAEREMAQIEGWILGIK